MDDIRPPRPGGSNYPNRSAGQQPNQIYNQSVNQQVEPQVNHDMHQEQDYHLPESHKKSGKGKTFALVLFILLFIASAGFSAYLYFVQMPQMQEDIDDAKAENERLLQQVYSLNYDNRDLQQKLLLEQQKNEQPAEADTTTE